MHHKLKREDTCDVERCIDEGLLKLTTIFYLFVLVAGLPLMAYGGDAYGKDFIVAFMENRVLNLDPIPKLYVTNIETETVNVTISIPLESWAVSFRLEPGAMKEQAFPSTAQLKGSAGLTTQGIHVVSTGDLSVQGANINDFTSDAFLVLPTDSLGTEYMAMSYLYMKPSHNLQGPSQLAVVGIYDETDVFITLPRQDLKIHQIPDIDIMQNGTISFDIYRFEAIQIQSSDDITGTLISASKPIAVLSGTMWTSVVMENMGDHLVEMLPPIPMWGIEFWTTPVANRSSGDVFRILAQESATEVRVLYGSYQYEFHGALLDAGQWHDFDISSTDSVHIVSNHPILVAQIAKSYDTDGNRQSDPMINLVVPYQQYTGRATFTTILAHNGDEFSNYLGIIIPSVYQESLKINGKRIENRLFERRWNVIQESEMSSGTLLLDKTYQGQIVVSHDDPDATFSVLLWGSRTQEVYGLPVNTATKSLNNPCVIVDMYQGDKFDNDCDCRVNEEILNEVDDDLDGYIDEDLLGHDEKLKHLVITKTTEGQFTTNYRITRVTADTTSDRITRKNTQTVTKRSQVEPDVDGRDHGEIMATSLSFDLSTTEKWSDITDSGPQNDKPESPNDDNNQNIINGADDNSGSGGNSDVKDETFVTGVDDKNQDVNGGVTREDIEEKISRDFHKVNVNFPTQTHQDPTIYTLQETKPYITSSKEIESSNEGSPVMESVNSLNLLSTPSSADLKELATPSSENSDMADTEIKTHTVISSSYTTTRVLKLIPTPSKESKSDNLETTEPQEDIQISKPVFISLKTTTATPLTESTRPLYPLDKYVTSECPNETLNKIVSDVLTWLHICQGSEEKTDPNFLWLYHFLDGVEPVKNKPRDLSLCFPYNTLLHSGICSIFSYKGIKPETILFCLINKSSTQPIPGWFLDCLSNWNITLEQALLAVFNDLRQPYPTNVINWLHENKEFITDLIAHQGNESNIRKILNTLIRASATKANSQKAATSTESIIGSPGSIVSTKETPINRISNNPITATVHPPTKQYPLLKELTASGEDSGKHEDDQKPALVKSTEEAGAGAKNSKESSKSEAPSTPFTPKRVLKSTEGGLSSKTTMPVKQQRKTVAQTEKPPDHAESLPPRSIPTTLTPLNASAVTIKTGGKSMFEYNKPLIIISGGVVIGIPVLICLCCIFKAVCKKRRSTTKVGPNNGVSKYQKRFKNGTANSSAKSSRSKTGSHGKIYTTSTVDVRHSTNNPKRIAYYDCRQDAKKCDEFSLDVSQLKRMSLSSRAVHKLPPLKQAPVLKQNGQHKGKRNEENHEEPGVQSVRMQRLLQRKAEKEAKQAAKEAKKAGQIKDIT